MIIKSNKTFFSFFLFLSFTFNVNAQSVGGSTSGGAIYCDTSNTGFLSLTGHTGTILTWESSTDSISWASTANTITAQSYYHLQETTWYRAIVQDGVSAPDTSTVSKLIIYPASEGGIISGGGLYCGGTGAGSLVLSSQVGTVQHWQYSTDNGSSWIQEANTTNTLNYTDFNEDRLYEAVVQTNIACPVDSSSQASFLYSPSVGGTLTGGGTYCDSSGIGTLSLTGNVGSILNWQSSTDNGSNWTTISHLPNLLNHPNITQNTLYEAVVQLGSCASVSSSQLSFVFAPSVAGSLSGTDSLCSGLNGGLIQLSSNVGDVINWLSSTDDGLVWLPVINVTGSLVYSNLSQTTWYKAVVKNGSCNRDTTSHLVITVYQLPLVDAGGDETITLGDSVLINATGEGSPTWSPIVGLDSISIFTPSASPIVETAYKITVVDSNLCVNADSLIISINVLGFTGKVANILTPNGDGINDTWFIENIETLTDSEVFVYNIYGVLVYTKKGYLNDWEGTFNGSALPDGTYFYVLQFESSDEVYKGALDILKNK